MSYVVVIESPDGGLAAKGPFRSLTQAQAYANKHQDPWTSCHPLPVESPDD